MDIHDIIEQIIKPQIKQPLWESWYIKEKIGSGSFSVVYRIEAQRPGGIDVSALKVEAIMPDGQIFSDTSRKTTFLNNRKQMAINEAQIMKKLRDCPYIVRYEEEHMQELYINEEFEGYYYLIRMEFLKNVYELMKKGQFSYSESNVKKLAVEIGQGLKAAHSIGIIHRDIKPDNMFVNDAGIYKLGDFNISKKAMSTRTYAGTQYYMAPEIFRARANVDASYTTQADIYSFGLCLYQMMNKGQLPFEDKMDPDAAYDKRMSDEQASFPPPCDATREFADIIRKACSFNPNERYKTIDDMLMDLSDKMRTKPNPTEYANTIAHKGENSPVYAGESDKMSLRKSNSTQYAGNDSYSKNLQGIKTKPIKPIVIAIVGILLVIGLAFGITKCTKSDGKSEYENSTIESEQPTDSQDSVVKNTNDESSTQTSIIKATVTTTTTQSESVVITKMPADVTQPTISENNNINLCDIKLVESENYLGNVSDSVKDSVGNTYNGNVACFQQSYGFGFGEIYALYYLGGKYKTLTGTIAITDASESGNTTMCILGNDNLLYSTDEISKQYVPTEFTINVEGIEWLKITNVPTEFTINVEGIEWLKITNTNHFVVPILANWVFE